MKKGKKGNEVLEKVRGGRHGMRYLLIDDLKDCRSEFPRRTNRAMSEFYGTSLVRRPLFGLHKLARLSEHYLAKAKFGKLAHRRFLEDAEGLFFAVRQVIRNYVGNHKAGERLAKADADLLREHVKSLLDDCRRLDGRFGSVVQCACPCCRGTGRVYAVTDSSERAVRDVLDAAVREGKLGFSRTLGYYGL